MVLDILGIFIAFMVGMIVGSYLFYRLLLNAVEKDPRVVIEQLFGDSVKVFNNDNIDELLDSLEAADDLDADDECLELVAETHGNQIYLFEDGTDRFVSQGTTLEEAVARAHERHPGINFGVWMDEQKATNDNS